MYIKYYNMKLNILGNAKIYLSLLIYRKPSIHIANGSCMFGMLFESVLIEVKNTVD